ncbi:MAG TPA: type II secretion system protein GspL [Dokdonella sp.]|uniref:type II secretion system protein GspL n=1 Tax=Dokdonella sp. TaxID=2291710 RepID=UPI002D7FC928|nr:type II secretion system protein GspL [Dokdonella sp.]HET9033002.1 type II secretion system protein GspL [Dokdonella sp.]
MSDRLILRLDRSDQLAWLRQSVDGRVLSSSQSTPPSAAVIAAADEIVVLVPAEDVLLIETRVNARSSAQLQQAVPFAVEDQLLGAVEDQHFAIHADNDGRVGVAVVARTRMQRWIATLAALGVRADVLIPESLVLPFSAESASAMIDQGQVLIRLDRWSALTCSSAQLSDWLTQVRASGIDRAIEAHDFDDESDAAIGQHFASYQAGLRDPLAFLARDLGRSAVNLLSGEFASDHRQARGTRWWRRVAIAAAAFVILAFVHRGLEVRQLGQEVANVDAAMTESLLKTFPDLGAAERSRAPQSVMRDRLERLRGGSESSGFLRLLGQIAPVLGRTTRTQMRGLEFRNGILEVGLRAPDVATLDSMREQFSAIPGLSAEVTASVPADTGVDGRIRIRGDAP